MKKRIAINIILILAWLLLWGLSADAAVKNLTATWDAPTTNADGTTPLTDLKGYHVYRIDIPIRTKIDSCDVLHPILTCNFSITVPDGSEGILRFVATAYDTTGNESKDSNEGSYIYDLGIPFNPAHFLIKENKP